MTKEHKNQWKVTVKLKDGTVINPEKYTIPAGHRIYRVIEQIQTDRKKRVS